MIKETKVPIEFDGITVITGNNNTGKSTVSKVLYCVFHSLYNINNSVKDYIDRHVEIYVASILPAISTVRHSVIKGFRDLIDDLITSNTRDIIYDKIKKFLDENKLTIDNDAINDAVDKIDKILNVSEEIIEKNIIENNFLNVFGNSVNCLAEGCDKNGYIRVELKEKNIEFRFRNDALLSCKSDIKVLHDATYYDGPYIMNSMLPINLHRNKYNEDLLSKMRRRSNESFDASINRTNIIDLFNSFNSFGNLDINFDDHTVRLNGLKSPISVSSLSNGLKAITFLKNLLLSGNISERDILILDEPEINLHPEWQIELAHILVLLQKKLSLTILLSTHSPYFLAAIDTFSYVEQIKDNCHYYLALADGATSSINDVSNDVEEVYKGLSDPYQKLLDQREKFYEKDL